MVTRRLAVLTRRFLERETVMQEITITTKKTLNADSLDSVFIVAKLVTGLKNLTARMVMMSKPMEHWTKKK